MLAGNVRKEISHLTVLVTALGLSSLFCMPRDAQAKEYAPAVIELMRRGDAALDAGRLTEARNYYEDALRVDPTCVDAHNQIGLSYSRKNQLAEAAAEFRKALEDDPEFLPALNNLGSVMYRLSNYDSAITFYQKALKLKNNQDPEVHTNLASVYRDRATFSGGGSPEADYEKAIVHYQEAIKQKPDFPQAHNNLGLCYVRIQKYADAEREIKKAIDIKKDYAVAYFNLGLALQKQGKASEAYSAFQNSLRYETVPQYAESTRQKMKELGITPGDNADHFARGYDYLLAHKWADAESEFRQVIKTTGPKNPVAWNNLGYAQAKQRQFPEAVASYQRAIKLLPGRFPAAQYNLGQVLRLSGDLRGAQAAYEKAVKEANGPHALAHNALGILLRARGQKSKALEHYKLALMQSGDTLPVVHYNIALLLETDGKINEAVEELKTYLSMNPEGANAQAARARISKLKR
jgi:tetratricopeptide (TPR) repeat protein